ncbi:guanylate kinase [Opitutales bacterium]|nr:guanylate kinase [Opitutales bacterium]MDC1004301.1 guanylate kinase [Opitutales bacterium]|tara:strand:+ start:418 stop:1005 length:588 start_codon:yes stop_codon:yes gene_type:complete
MNSIALVISGPAGVGKTTLCDRLLSDFETQLTRVITVTTRHPREGEADGKDYLFITKLEFEDLIEVDAFIEYAQIHDNYYGSLKKTFLELFQKDQDVLLNIDVQGTTSLKNLESSYPFLKNRVISVFVMPKSLNELRDRLKTRNLDTTEEIEKRLTTAANEIKSNGIFDYTIESSTKDEDYKRLVEIYKLHSQNL